MGVYHHPAPPGSGFHSNEVRDTYEREAEAFVDSYAAKSALWLSRLLP